jgi:hypothetical protein
MYAVMRKLSTTLEISSIAPEGKMIGYRNCFIYSVRLNSGTANVSVTMAKMDR